MLLFLGAGLGSLRLVASRTRRVESVLGHALIADLDPAAVVNAASVIFGAESAVLFRVSADRSDLRPVSAVGIEDLAPLLALEALPGAARAMRAMQPLVVAEEPLGTTGARSAAFVPLRLASGAFGLLALFDRRRGRFRRADPRVLVALGIAAGRSLERPGGAADASVAPVGAPNR